MVRVLLSLLSLALVSFTGVSASGFTSPNHHDLAARVLSSHMEARQDAEVDVSDIPDACKTNCAAITKIYTDSTCTNDAGCICKDDTLTSYADCAMCVVGLVADDRKDEATGQVKDALSRLASDCEKEAGVKLNVPTVTTPSTDAKQDSAQSTDAQGSAQGLMQLSAVVKVTAALGGAAMLFL